MFAIFMANGPITTAVKANDKHGLGLGKCGHLKSSRSYVHLGLSVKNYIKCLMMTKLTVTYCTDKYLTMPMRFIILT